MLLTFTELVSRRIGIFSISYYERGAAVNSSMAGNMILLTRAVPTKLVPPSPHENLPSRLVREAIQVTIAYCVIATEPEPLE